MAVFFFSIFFSSYVEKSGCYDNIDLKYGKCSNISDNSKSTSNIFMKLEIWINGSMENIRLIFLWTYGGTVHLFISHFLRKLYHWPYFPYYWMALLQTWPQQYLGQDHSSEVHFSDLDLWMTFKVFLCKNYKFGHNFLISEQNYFKLGHNTPSIRPFQQHIFLWP